MFSMAATTPKVSLDSLFAESIQHLQSMHFFYKSDPKKYTNLFEAVRSLQSSCKAENVETGKLKVAEVSILMKCMDEDFNLFVLEGCRKSEMFRNWNTFITLVFTVLGDMIHDNREGNWEFHIFTS
jgi:hypothetical protein